MAGATKGALDWGKEQIRALVKRFQNKDLAFIEDDGTIGLVKEQRHGSEWSIYTPYLRDKNLRLLVQMGLALRRLERQPLARDALRDKIVHSPQFGKKGLHIAEFVQHEALSKIISIAASEAASPADLSARIEHLLNDIEKYAVFIHADTSVQQKADELRIRLFANLPDQLVLFGSGSAIRVTQAVAGRLKKAVDVYRATAFQDDVKIIIIFTKTR